MYVTQRYVVARHYAQILTINCIYFYTLLVQECLLKPNIQHVPNVRIPLQIAGNLPSKPLEVVVLEMHGLEKRLGLPIYTDKSRRHKLLVVKPDNQQLKLQFPKFR
jgi:hypothetical protein